MSGRSPARGDQQSNYPKIDHVCEVVQKLIKKGLCRSVLGKKDSRWPAVEHLREQLMYEDGKQTHPDLRRIVEGVAGDFEVHVTSAMERVEAIHLGGLMWTEIRMRGR